MSTTEVKGALEALLFVSDEPVSGAKLADILDTSPGDIDSLLFQISSELKEQNRGFQLREVAGGWRLFTHPAHHQLIEKYILSWDTRRLSQAALEALAVVAYNQPVVRNQVSAIRGVNSDGVISSLIEKGLIREVGRDKNQGNAILYGTSRTFLEKFGLASIDELPSLEEFAPESGLVDTIKERLGMNETIGFEVDEDLLEAFNSRAENDFRGEADFEEEIEVVD